MTRALLELCRISNLPTVWTNVIAAWVIASGGANWRAELLWLLVGASLIYSAGMILNDTFDAAWDREKRPERPIPSGRIGLGTAWAIGLGGLVGGYAVMVFAGGANWGVTALLLAAIVLYDAYHKPWAGAVFIMGACRTLLYLTLWLPGIHTAYAALHKSLGPTVLIDLNIASLEAILLAGVILGFYIVALTSTARAEGAGKMTKGRRILLTFVLMMPAIRGLVTVVAALSSGLLWTALLEALALVAFVLWTNLALRQMRKGGPAIGEAVGLLLAGIPLVDALMMAPNSPVIAFGFCFLPPFLRYWQRWVAAT